ncbi:MAG: hypothetical protein LBS82_01480 [Spirochaetaceae bacterium]|nr:hypothetical protein [Spirochaetaceae bacterium]
MTEEEATKLDEEVTRNPPAVKSGQKGGFFAEHAGNIVVVDNLSAAYIRSRAEATGKSQTEVAGELVRQRIAVPSP